MIKRIYSLVYQQVNEKLISFDFSLGFALGVITLFYLGDRGIDLVLILHRLCCPRCLLFLFISRACLCFVLYLIPCKIGSSYLF